MIGVLLTFATIPVLGLLAVRWITSSRRALQLLRGNRRLARGFCPRCGYDLAGLNHVGVHCPECGHTFTAAERRRLRRIGPYLLRTRQDRP